MIQEKLNIKIVDKVNDSATSVNLCEEVEVGEEMMINYTYTDMGRQMILNIGAPVSITSVPWMEQYLEAFDLEIQDLKAFKCHQPFVFRLSQSYVSESLVELPVLVTRLDRRDDVLIIQTYLVDAEVPFLCRKQILES